MFHIEKTKKSPSYKYNPQIVNSPRMSEIVVEANEKLQDEHHSGCLNI